MKRSKNKYYDFNTKDDTDEVVFDINNGMLLPSLTKKGIEIGEKDKVILKITIK